MSRSVNLHNREYRSFLSVKPQKELQIKGEIYGDQENRYKKMAS